MVYLGLMSNTTNDQCGEYKRLCPDGRHEDPDRSGLCVKCWGILDPDADDWKETPERCIGERPKGEYKREPLLSDAKCDELDLCDCHGSGASYKVRSIYESMITSGELMVVRTVKHEERDSFIHCSGCEWKAPWEVLSYSPKMNHCPGCGAKITQ